MSCDQRYAPLSSAALRYAARQLFAPRVRAMKRDEIDGKEVLL
jgi:hypothetical protein